jgi:hypothetical protein
MWRNRYYRPIMRSFHALCAKNTEQQDWKGAVRTDVQSSSHHLGILNAPTFIRMRTCLYVRMYECVYLHMYCNLHVEMRSD